MPKIPINSRPFKRNKHVRLGINFYVAASEAEIFLILEFSFADFEEHDTTLQWLFFILRT